MLRGQGLARVALSVALIALGAYTLEGFLRALVWAVILAIATWPLFLRTKQRFGAGRVSGGGEFVSVAEGLALIGQDRAACRQG